jgi:ketosteroid isomerase-like protein
VPLAPPTQTSRNDARRAAKRLLGLELEVLSMENELTAVLLHGHVAALRRIYADDYVSVNPEGILAEKASVLRDLESGEIKFISIHTDGVAVHVHENAAVVTGRADLHLRFGGEESREQLKFMHVYIKRDRRWLLVAQQLTRIARPL